MRLKLPSIIEQQERLRRSTRIIRAVLSYLGPGFLVTVGFIDPGNWATNLSAGAHFGYNLLWVVTLGTLILILWQHMSAHLGVVTGKCLAEAVREHCKPAASVVYGITAIGACVATALAEILGAAIGINILFHIPLRLGALLATVLVIFLLWFQKYSQLERIIVGFVSFIGLCYLVELWIVKPNWQAAALHSVVPSLNSASILIAMGVLGAVVMPHNMYLHSEVIQNRNWTGRDEAETRRLLRFEFLDTSTAMLVGLVINAAMVIVAAAVFHRHSIHVTDLVQASDTLKPLTGQLSSVLFAVALLFAGIASSVTAGVAGGTTFSGYLGKSTDLQSKAFRIGMLFTLVPAALGILLVKNTFDTLVISQVCLSAQLPLTMLPLFLLTISRKVMGKFVNGWFETTLMILTGLLVVFLNCLLLYQLLGGKF